jgi:hypothetical protein
MQGASIPVRFFLIVEFCYQDFYQTKNTITDNFKTNRSLRRI